MSNYKLRVSGIADSGREIVKSLDRVFDPMPWHDSVFEWALTWPLASVLPQPDQIL